MQVQLGFFAALARCCSALAMYMSELHIFLEVHDTLNFVKLMNAGAPLLTACQAQNCLFI